MNQIFNTKVIFMSKFKITKTVPVGPVPTMEIARETQRQIRTKLQRKSATCKFSKITKSKDGFKFSAVSSVTVTANSSVTELKKAIESQIQVAGAKVSVVNLSARAKRSNS